MSTQDQERGSASELTQLLGAWEPIDTAPRDGSTVLVNDTTPGWHPWAAACYQDGGGWSGWVYDDTVSNDANPRGPRPTHWLPIPPVPSA